MKSIQIVEEIFLLSRAAKILIKINRLSNEHKKIILSLLESYLTDTLQNSDIVLNGNLHLAIHIGYQSLSVLKLIKDKNTDTQKCEELIDDIISKSLKLQII